MKTRFAKLTLIAVLGAAGATTGFAHEDYSEGASLHRLAHVSEATSQATANQLAPYGYATSGAAARTVNVDSGTRHLNVTRGEIVQINVGGKRVTWAFDTLGTVPFPLSSVVPGADGVTVYVAANLADRGG